MQSNINHLGQLCQPEPNIEAFCAEANAKYTFCSQDSSSLSGAESQMVQVCKESTAYAYLQGIRGLCTTSINVHSTQQQNFLSSSIASTYLIRKAAELEHRINVMDNQYQNTVTAILLTSVSMIQNFAALDRPLLLSTDDIPSEFRLVELQEDGTTNYNVSKWDIENGAAVQECECGDSWSCSISLGDSVTRTCSLFETIMNAPVTVWQDNVWWRNGLGIDISSYSSIDENVLFSTDGLVFAPSSSYPYDYTFKDAFKDGFVKYRNIAISFDDYYSECAPSTCIYYERSRRSLIDVISVLAGLLGGLTVAAKLFIKFVCFRKVKKVRMRIASTAEASPIKRRTSASLESIQLTPK